jgi:hypothetical protein
MILRWLFIVVLIVTGLIEDRLNRGERNGSDRRTKNSLGGLKRRE